MRAIVFDNIMMAFAMGFEASCLDLHGGLMCVDGGATIGIQKDILLSPLLKNRLAWQNIKVSLICFFCITFNPHSFDCYLF
jgi:hypothetical protein